MLDKTQTMLDNVYVSTNFVYVSTNFEVEQVLLFTKMHKYTTDINLAV